MTYDELPSKRTAPPVILVAEDSKYDRLILEEAFAELSFDISLRFVTDGEDLLDYLHRRNAYAAADSHPFPSLVLMDLNMPRMNGSDALIAVRGDAVLRAIPIIILSTSDNPKQIANAYAHGVNAFVTKPGRFDDFVELLRNFGAFWLRTANLPPVESWA